MPKHANKPKILFWDLETSHNIVAAFRLFDKHSGTPHDNILQERYIISGAWAFGDGEINSVTVADFGRFKRNPNDDKGVVKRLHRVLSKADAVVAHYGDAFDMKYFNARCVFHGLSPVPPIVQIDTYKIAKNKFLFNSNRLDYLGKFLKVGGKRKTSPSLWLKCLRGDRKAIGEMARYNRDDVALLRKVFLRLQPFAPARLSHALFRPGACPACGSTNTQWRGYVYTKQNKYRRFQCLKTGCRTWHRSTKSITARKAA